MDRRIKVVYVVTYGLNVRAHASDCFLWNVLTFAPDYFCDCFTFASLFSCFDSWFLNMSSYSFFGMNTYEWSCFAPFFSVFFLEFTQLYLFLYYDNETINLPKLEKNRQPYFRNDSRLIKNAVDTHEKASSIACKSIMRIAETMWKINVIIQNPARFNYTAPVFIHFLVFELKSIGVFTLGTT